MSLETFVFNIGGNFRRETLDGRKYLVVPATMLVEGVVPGSAGALYYPEKELSKTPAVWNHKPIVVNHPMKDGKGITACDKHIIESRGVGMMMNAEYPGKLRSEAWFDEEKTKKIEPRIITAIEKNQKMEVSTGLFTDNELTEGEFKGKKYIGIARNYRPDHLAILPDSIGACSIADGAGLNVNENTELNKNLVEAMQRSKLLMAEMNGHITVNGLSHSDIHKQLSSSMMPIGNMAWDGWVEDVYDNFYIYRDNGKFYKDNYTVDANLKVNPEKKPTEVKKHTEYRTMDGMHVAPKNVTYNEEKPVATEPVVVPPVQNTTPPVVAPAVVPLPVAVVTPVATPPVVNKPLTLQEYIQNAPAEIQEPLNELVTMQNQEKARLIGIITTNSRNEFTADQLKEMKLPMLRSMAKLATTVDPTTTNTHPIYAGAAGPVPTANGNGQQQALPAPVMNFDRKSK